VENCPTCSLKPAATTAATAAAVAAVAATVWWLKSDGNAHVDVGLPESTVVPKSYWHMCTTQQSTAQHSTAGDDLKAQSCNIGMYDTHICQDLEDNETLTSRPP